MSNPLPRQVPNTGSHQTHLANGDSPRDDQRAQHVANTTSDSSTSSTSPLSASIAAAASELSPEILFLIKEHAKTLKKLSALQKKVEELERRVVDNESSCASHQQYHHGQQLILVGGGGGGCCAGASGSALKLSSASGGSANGLVISDDSGGEYSRPTTDDDDELSSLLDRITKISQQLQESQAHVGGSSGNVSVGVGGGVGNGCSHEIVNSAIIQQQYQHQAPYMRYSGGSPSTSELAMSADGSGHPSPAHYPTRGFVSPVATLVINSIPTSPGASNSSASPRHPYFPRLPFSLPPPAPTPPHSSHAQYTSQNINVSNVNNYPSASSALYYEPPVPPPTGALFEPNVERFLEKVDHQLLNLHPEERTTRKTDY